jgi:hypothetical protein
VITRTDVTKQVKGMAKRYIIQKREVKERHGKRPHLMGPYRTVYSDIKPPFDLSDREKIESHLLREYGEGRYQVKSVGREEGEERSRITIHFTGDIERYRPRARVWTKEERVYYLRGKWRTSKEKSFALAAFFAAFLLLLWVFMLILGSTWDSSLIVLAAIVIVIVFLAAAFFIDMMFFETE